MIDRLEIAPTPDGWIVIGEIDSHAAPILSEALLERSSGDLVLDIASVTFMDSSGLQSVIDATRRLRAAGGDLTLRNPGPAVVRLLQVTGLQGFLRVEC